MVKSLLKKGQMLAIGTVMVFTMLATTATTIVSTRQAAAAAACDKVNIVYCGLDGSSASGYVNSFKSKYNANKSGHASSPSVKKDYTDVQALYNWAGASKTIVSGMSTTNTQVGTLYKNGNITVDGKTIATDAWVTARFNGNGFKHVTSNIYARKTTTSFAQSSAKVIVHMKDGKMVFAVMVDCGNAVKATPKTTPKPPEPPKPTPVVTCESLTFAKTATKNEYAFVAKASVKDTTITGYVFNFGDTKTQTVTTGATTTNTTHKYDKAGTYTAFVSVNSKVKNNVTSAKCAVKIVIPVDECKPGIPVGDERCKDVPPVTPEMSCDQLVFSNNKKQFSFIVQASAKNATIDSYIVDFGDGSAIYNGKDAAVDHTYAKAGTYTVKASVTVTANGKTQTITGTKCTAKVTVPVDECKPGVPVGSKECEETPPVTPPETPEVPTPETPAELPKTGAASAVGLFAGISIAGAAAHRLFASRRGQF